MGTTMTGVRMPIRVRFVGGCWHNMLPVMTTLPPVISTSDGVHTYHLAEFYSEAFRTPYYQYVHSSLIGPNGVSLKTCREDFPYWEPDLNKVSQKPRRRWPRKQAFRQN